MEDFESDSELAAKTARISNENGDKSVGDSGDNQPTQVQYCDFFFNIFPASLILFLLLFWYLLIFYHVQSWKKAFARK